MKEELYQLLDALKSAGVRIAFYDYRPIELGKIPEGHKARQVVTVQTLRLGAWAIYLGYASNSTAEDLTLGTTIARKHGLTPLYTCLLNPPS